METSLFSLGQTVITHNALNLLHPEDLKTSLGRHAQGDWGDLCESDWKENEVALAQGLRLFSVYRDRAKVKFYVITEADRSATTALLPEEY